VTQCAYVESTLTDARFFASPCKFGKDGVEEVLPLALPLPLALTSRRCCRRCCPSARPTPTPNVKEVLPFGELALAQNQPVRLSVLTLTPTLTPTRCCPLAS